MEIWFINSSSLDCSTRGAINSTSNYPIKIAKTEIHSNKYMESQVNLPNNTKNIQEITWWVVLVWTLDYSKTYHSWMILWDDTLDWDRKEVKKKCFWIFNDGGDVMSSIWLMSVILRNSDIFLNLTVNVSLKFEKFKVNFNDTFI